MAHLNTHTTYLNAYTTHRNTKTTTLHSHTEHPHTDTNNLQGHTRHLYSQTTRLHAHTADLNGNIARLHVYYSVRILSSPAMLRTLRRSGFRSVEMVVSQRVFVFLPPRTVKPFLPILISAAACHEPSALVQSRLTSSISSRPSSEISIGLNLAFFFGLSSSASE